MMIQRFLLLVALSFSVAACGGGGSSPEAHPKSYQGDTGGSDNRNSEPTPQPQLPPDPENGEGSDGDNDQTTGPSPSPIPSFMFSDGTSITNNGSGIISSTSQADRDAFANNWGSNSNTPWNNSDVSAAWRSGWTGQGVNVGIVDDFQNDLPSARFSGLTHGHVVHGIIKGNNIVEAISGDRVFTPGMAYQAGIYTARMQYPHISTNTNGVVHNTMLRNHSYGTGLYTNFNAPGEHVTLPSRDQRSRVLTANLIKDTYVTDGKLNVVAAGNDGLSCSTIFTCNTVALAFTGNLQHRYTNTNRDDPWEGNTTWSRDADNTNIVVGSVSGDENSPTDNIAGYSQRAGVLKNDFIVTYGTGGLYQGNGTSYAAPRVTGAAALVIDKFDTNAANTKQIILQTADDLGAPGIDDVFGHGRLNVGRALSPVGTLR